MAYETLEVRREDGTNRLYWRGARVFVEKSIRDDVDRLPKGAKVEAECRYDAGAVTVVRIVKIVGVATAAKADLRKEARALLGRNDAKGAAALLDGAEEKVERDPQVLFLRFQARSRIAAERDGAVRDFRRLLELAQQRGEGAPTVGELAIELGRSSYEARLACEGDLLEYLEAHREEPDLDRALGAVAPAHWPPALQTRWLRALLDTRPTAVRDPRLPIVCDLLQPRAASEPLVAELLHRAAPLREEHDLSLALAARERQAMVRSPQGVEAAFGVSLPVELRRAWSSARDLKWEIDGAPVGLIPLHERSPKELLGIALELAAELLPGVGFPPGREAAILPFASDDDETRFLCLWLAERRRGRELPVIVIMSGKDLVRIESGRAGEVEVFAETFAQAASLAR